MPPRPGPLATAFPTLLLALLIGLTAGCTASNEPDPAPPPPPPSGEAANADPAADLCSRIDYALASPAFGAPLDAGPVDDGIGSRHSCTQVYQGADGAPGGVVDVRTVTYDSREAARATFEAGATASTVEPFPDTPAIAAEAVRYHQTGQITSIELLQGRLTVKVDFTPTEELGQDAATLPTTTVAFTAHVLDLLPET
jgi:hypothetical protein